MKEPDISDLITRLNIDAMKNLSSGNMNLAQKLLKKAMVALSSFSSPINLQVVTLNNFGCYYKQTSQLKTSLKYFKQSLMLQKALGSDEITLAGTHLNISTLYTDLGNYNLALNEATESISIIKNSNLNSEKASITLALSYHRMAAIQQAISNTEKCLECIKIAMSITKDIPSALKLHEFLIKYCEQIEKTQPQVKEKILSMREKVKDKEREKDKDKEREREKPKSGLGDYKKLPKITKLHFKKRSAHSPSIIQQPKLRFFTGDRLRPMFLNSEVRKDGEVEKTFKSIKGRLSQLQEKLNNFHGYSDSLKGLLSQDQIYDSFSEKSIEALNKFTAKHSAAKKIQNFFKKVARKNVD